MSVNIIFYSSWGDSPSDCLKKYSMQTPGCRGVWENIVGVDDPDLADFFVMMDGGENIDLVGDKKKIYIQREPDYLKKNKFKNKDGVVFSYKNGYHASIWWILKKFDFLSGLQYPGCKRKSSAIISNKEITDTQRMRICFLENFSNKYPGFLDIYGKGLSKRNIKNYKGEIPCKCKFDGLINYDFSFCSENGRLNNYFTEKICDSFLCWTMPIYYGCPNISEFFPEKSYYNIDIFKDDCVDTFFEIINRDISKENIESIRESRNLVLYKYNIWEVLNSIIKEI